MEEFKLNQEVYVLDTSGYKQLVGKKAFIREINDTDEYLLQFDKDVSGLHNGGSYEVRLDSATGWYVQKKDLGINKNQELNYSLF